MQDDIELEAKFLNAKREPRIFRRHGRITSSRRLC
jgi:hypothetical protein